MNTKPFSQEELQSILDEKADLYNRLEFIETDPISVPHRFSEARDIEIAGFLAATIAWGQRVTLIRNANWLLDRMDNAPADFICDFSDADLKPFEKFVHRTFNGEDCIFFLQSLQRILNENSSFENLFQTEQGDVKSGIIHFRKCFLGEDAPSRTTRHVSNPDKNSAAKRINMFLRWMIRNDKRKVDFGIWKVFTPAQLICPLDVHSGGVARKLGILQRTQDDWQAAEELSLALSSFDPLDPVKYDYALFGLGVFEGFRKG
jgi:uncharacterized protein (TIGR02757 family)